jgi:hypothetical protein
MVLRDSERCKCKGTVVFPDVLFEVFRLIIISSEESEERWWGWAEIGQLNLAVFAALRKLRNCF